VTALLRVQMCADCGREILPVLRRATTDERLFLSGIAAKLQRCEACRAEGKRLREYVTLQGRDGWSFWGA
jgi:hypothetical protein